MAVEGGGDRGGEEPFPLDSVPTPLCDDLRARLIMEVSAQGHAVSRGTG